MDNDEMLVVIKGLFDRKTDEIKQYVDEKINGQGALIESLRSDIRTVAEGHDILNRKHDILNRKIDAIDEKIDNTKQELTTRIDKLDKNMEIVKEYVIGVDAKLNEHEIILKRVK